MTFRGDTYSQARRWQPGFSDCSSFVGKAFKALGISPPGASTTMDYPFWAKLRAVPRAQLGAGDLCVRAGSHMVIAIDNRTGIGQERPGRNVVIGDIDTDLMVGQKPYSCLRYTG